MTQQPLGAGGGILRSHWHCRFTDIGRVYRVYPCYILDSSKPIWRGELQTCGVLLGTNALEALWFQITQANTAVEPDPDVKQSEPTCSSRGNVHPSMLQIALIKELHLGPHEKQVVRAKLNLVSQQTKGVVGILGPKSNLAMHSCDLVEELWTGATEVKIPITNWSTTPVVVPMN